MPADRDTSFRRYAETRRGHLLRAATLLTAGDLWAAEDLVQTTLTRLYVAWPRVSPDAVDAYARRCLLNALIDNRRLAFMRRERSHAEVPDTPVEPDLPFDRQSAVFRALADLPPRMRAAVVMRHLLDLSLEETATALHCRVGTVKSQTARGLERLGALLADDGIRLEIRSMSETDPPAALRPTAASRRRIDQPTITR